MTLGLRLEAGTKLNKNKLFWIGGDCWMAADVRLSEPTLNWTRAVAGTELGKNMHHLF